MFHVKRYGSSAARLEAARTGRSTGPASSVEALTWASSNPQLYPQRYPLGYPPPTITAQANFRVRGPNLHQHPAELEASDIGPCLASATPSSGRGGTHKNVVVTRERGNSRSRP